MRALTPSDDSRFDDEPAWSPDGRTIAFVRTGGASMGDLWLVDADGGDARALMREEEPPFDQRSPTWSPDGALVAYVSHHEIIGNRAGDWQLYTVRADGTGVVRRTSTGYDERNAASIAR
ncbi:WD40-like beta Propeller containing protein [Gemmatirosa kalamazoonensis]|uniref:WD40-like beta Propeller containing protein n=1 Tax=Gemmatirosa kalamazoonensis TaxID=861299 RepID=W0RE51_9BACT|nr:PD40 domain-containing protein [Gemmatirosa kalamazoonensis]AHG88692.1 WD40-like beta Propeller containing protein [Gemmatirosa kalamazoonensis]